MHIRVLKNDRFSDKHNTNCLVVRIIFVSRMLFLGPKRTFMLRNMLLYLGR